MRLKDRRKPWQKECINFSWSLCGTIATERVGKTLEKAIAKARADGRLPSAQTETDEEYLDRIRQLLAA